LAVTVKDARDPLWNIVLLDKRKPVLRACRESVRAVTAANELHALVSVLIRKADDEDKATAASRATAVRAEATTSIAEQQRFATEFVKLAQLKETGRLRGSLGK